MRRPSSVRGLLRAMLPLLCAATGRAADPPRPPEVWAVVVGIDGYDHPGIPDGRSSVRNAQGVLRAIRRMGWDDRHQVLLTDFGSVDPGRPARPSANILPTRRNLRWAVETYILENAKAGDLVVFYFAGESRFAVRPRGAQLDVEHFILPRDADPGNPGQTGWSLDEAVAQCVRRKLRIVCWLATVPVEAQEARPPAGPSPAAAVGPARAEGGASGMSWLSRLARWPGVTAWLAADRPRPGAAGRDASPGDVFTGALLEALGGSGPAPRGDRRPNLAACLKDLHQDPRLRLQGFCSMGGVPPSMTLWPDDLRGLAMEPRPDLIIQAGHADRVTAMAFPADGRLIATASRDSTVRIWSAPDRSLLRVLADQSVGVTALALTRDDRWLISGGGRGDVLVHDRAEDFRPISLEADKPHHAGIHQIALLPDGLHFVSIDTDGRSALWDPSRSPLQPRPWLADVVCNEVAVGGRKGPDGRDTGLVAARCGDGMVRIFDAEGSGGIVRPLARPHPATIAVSPDGRLLAAGYDDGLVIVHHLNDQRRDEYRSAERRSAVERLVFSPAGRLAIGHEAGVRLVGVAIDPPIAGADAAPARPAFDLLDHPAQHLEFSPGGDYLAACTKEIGAVRAWRMAGEGAPAPVLDDPGARASLVGFTGNGRGLAIADFDGAVDFRPLDPRGDEVSWGFPAHRGKVRQMSASPNRQFLLFLDEQRGARIWDLKERTCRRLPGTHRAGAFLDDDRIVLIPDSNAAANAGRPVLVDRSGGPVASPSFAAGAGAFRIPDGIPFERLAVSADGGRVAAASDSGKEPLVCVWETRGGGLSHWMTADRLEDPVVALAFSGDGRYLLTGAESPEARLWMLPAGGGEVVAPAVRFADPSVRAYVTCVAIRPDRPGQVVTGHSDGQVHAWKWDGGRASLDAPPLVVREFSTAVKALCFTPDGQYLAASGDGKRIWVGAMEPRPHRVDALDRLGAHHDEQINALLAWRGPGAAGPERPILISGSDDTTIRFWDLRDRALRGTFSAANRPAVGGAAVVQELDWVLYTPEGYFDASAEATKLVQYRRPVQSRAAGGRDRDRDREPGGLAVGLRSLEVSGTLDQLSATYHVYGLGEKLAAGEIPAPRRKPDEPSPIAIGAPTRTDPKADDARVTITLGSADFQDVRLYHNDAPIPSGWAPDPRRGPEAGPLTLEVPVKLLPGSNRFYVMASRPGAYDSCSRVVEIDYDARPRRGRVHVLALGVKDYENRPLRYAEDDAERLSEFLHVRGVDVEGQPGVRHVLRGADVNRMRIDRVFDEIARRVEDRPQDTVVVFLAGHTGVFDPQRFCLLLPGFPFPEEKPLPVAMRGAPPAAGGVDKVDPQFVLPYSIIEANLARLRALNRLVIVDACQAASILDDPKVREIRKWIETSSRRARTSYLMAARRGEPAVEIAALSHGLFTYALLRGMRAVGPDDEPREVAALALPPDADFDRDGIVSTDELDAYAKQVLPPLSGLFPRLVAARREAIVARDGQAAVPAPQPVDQALRLQATEASFPLIPIGRSPGDLDRRARGTGPG